MRCDGAVWAQRPAHPLGLSRIAQDHEIERGPRLAANRVEVDFADDLPDVAELERT
jgi:hypothetical protein